MYGKVLAFMTYKQTLRIYFLKVKYSIENLVREDQNKPFTKNKHS
jgi:hypothetical protein